ncbi:hypothetical protein ONS95_003348 [Cadophora gregata]|uniref:uncharacterized protein n=1 Tax=Cadophora gregata TaxID=51156 RepID=UPI0026DC64F2|nr:uncharacterized protein ONS95_003348 [Cadophora gregata]KAK0108548.1 hypothetical protein ONS95_003348 [Cadophora gregata]KAK0108859.1 hypothetical protein ONS96_002698 [Cadophora gregata f. sp. sojae]
MSCPSCLTGGISTSQPTGTTSTIHGLPTYIASPPSGTTPKAVIVLITDAFGWDFVNNRVLADHYAKRGGYLVYVPDFMNGKAMSPTALPLMDNLTTPSPTYLHAILHKPLWVMHLLLLAIPWKSSCDPIKTHPRVLSFLQSLRASPPPFALPVDTGSQSLKIGVAGFCWGGKHAFMLAQPSPEGENNLADCIFIAHPSYITLPSEVQHITIPTSVIVGDADAVLKKPQAVEMKRLLEAKGAESKGAESKRAVNGGKGEGIGGKGEGIGGKGEGIGGQGGGKEIDHEMVILEGAKHGFAIRTHADDEKEMEMAMRAEEQALRWFERWLVGGGTSSIAATTAESGADVGVDVDADAVHVQG